MKVLLTAINAKYIHSNPAIYSLYAYAREYADYIEPAEYTINNPEDFILEGIYRSNPDVLCFSCYIWNIDQVKRVASEFHKLKPKVPIWVGGPEVSYETDEFLLANDWASGIMVGEGEATFKQLVEYYIGKDISLEDIKSIVYRNEAEGCLVHTAIRDIISLNDIPFIYENMKDFSNRIVYYESSRGCPFSCSYCLSSVDKTLRFRDTGLVKNELQFFIDNRVPQVKFIDRTFNCRHEHALEIWKYINEHDNGVTNFHFEISADLLKEEEISLMSQMRPGLIQLEIGVQSTNPDTIHEIHRTMDLDKLKAAVLRINSFKNIHMHLDLIAGLPNENLESFSHSFDDIYSLKPDQLQLGFLKVLKGSFMYEHAKEYDVLYHANAPYEVLKTQWITYDDILLLKRVEEMVEVYYNSGQYNESIKVLEVLSDRPFIMFLRLGDFYDRKGYFNMSHSRIRRAEIVLEFVDECYAEQEQYEEIKDIVKQALIFDLYGRENCKTRPAWAPDPGSFKEIRHRFCRQGKLTHIEPFDYYFAGDSEGTLNSLPKRLDEKVWYLFDYQNRNPLDNQAHIERVDIYAEDSAAK